VPLTDLGFDQDWLVTDLRLTGPDPGLPRLTQQWCDPARPVTYVPGHGSHRRWELQVQPGERREDLVRPENLWPLLGRWITPDQAVIARAVVYRFHAVVAERMRIGRVFLAGDAAHQMPPFLGQGLCSGLRDAANLAWKLDLVTGGLASDALLDTYDEERRPHATGIVAHAVDSGRLIDQLAGRTSAGIGVDAGYGGGRGMPGLESGFLVPGHPLVGRPIPAGVVGGPPALAAIGSRLALVATPGVDRSRLSPRWAALGAVPVDVPAGPLPEGTLLVMRPDRYVAGVATGAEAIAGLEAGLLARC
jgi:3-(3-hydroxy-phenyl)propionate hydroxylase